MPIMNDEHPTSTDTAQTPPPKSPIPPKLSIFSGPITPPLLLTNLGNLLQHQAIKFPNREAVICPGQARLTYLQLSNEASKVAKGLLALGIQHGDRIGILCGNRSEYITLIFAAGQIGAILVVLNNGYTPRELRRAVALTGIKAIFTSERIGPRDNLPNLNMLVECIGTSRLPDLLHIILVKEGKRGFKNYQQLLADGENISDMMLHNAERQVRPSDICNIQFTSGTSGDPKAAQLSHISIINNGRFIGDRMELTEHDVVCCPPPLFHCFGLVLGTLAVITHGAAIVFPSETFDARLCMEVVINEKCTMLHGVPTMFVAYLSESASIPGLKSKLSLRGGIAAGSPASRQLLLEIFEKFDMRQLTNTYGMTETSPASFMTSPYDPFEKRVTTVGRLLPHTLAKIIGPDGEIVPLGVRGELCVSGYLLQAGYWENSEKTAEVMIKDSSGRLWMHTGDEGCFDEDGYCQITGRLKDVIIRGGENIYPLEIEERLLQHPTICQASVVGIPDSKYGESVGAFLKAIEGHGRPTLAEIGHWVQMTLARHKTPTHVFWLGDPGVGSDMPQTQSGKVQKNKLRAIGEKLVCQPKISPKL